MVGQFLRFVLGECFYCLFYGLSGVVFGFPSECFDFAYV